MLAKRLATILPPLTLGEALETTKIHSVAGRMRQGEALLATRPFRSPHHTISDVALVGGGSFPQPGEISLAHNGVLFLDELPEFKRTVLEVMRQPLEERLVTISRARFTVDFPASTQLVAAMNPWGCVAKRTKPFLVLRKPAPVPEGIPSAPKTVGDHILAQRLKRRLMQHEAADVIGVKNAETILGWEKNIREPIISEWPGILKFLGYYPFEVVTFGDEVLRFRRENGLNFRKLADLAGIDPATASRIEQNRKGVSKKCVSRIKEVLGIDD